MPLDPLRFRDVKRYTERLKENRAKTGAADAVRLSTGHLEGREIVAAVQDFEFMGGSLGMAAGEAIITGMMAAVDKHCPFIIFTASGGARMQEGMFSLMQMPRTTVAVQRLRAARLPYIVVLTNPTTGGVTASYAMLGDVHIANPAQWSVLPARASSSRRSASGCRRVFSAPNICRRTAWSTWSCRGSKCAPRWPGSARC